MSLLTNLGLSEFRRLTTKDINNYIDTINMDLNEHINKGGNWTT